jgi:hypothetical protein
MSRADREHVRDSAAAVQAMLAGHATVRGETAKECLELLASAIVLLAEECQRLEAKLGARPVCTCDRAGMTLPSSHLPECPLFDRGAWR